MDLSKLTPAPWFVDGPKSHNGLCDVRSAHVGGFADFPCPNIDRCVAEFIALARNAFDGDPEALAWWEANRRKR